MDQVTVIDVGADVQNDKDTGLGIDIRHPSHKNVIHFFAKDQGTSLSLSLSRSLALFRLLSPLSPSHLLSTATHMHSQINSTQWTNKRGSVHSRAP